MNIFRGRDIRRGFDKQKKDGYEKIFQMVEDIYWEVVLKEKKDFNELDYMANSFGSKLMTDRKIAAISFYLSELGKTLILTRDRGLERVVNRIKTQHENPVPIQRYYLQKSLLEKVEVFTPFQDSQFYL